MLHSRPLLVRRSRPLAGLLTSFLLLPRYWPQALLLGRIELVLVPLLPLR